MNRTDRLYALVEELRAVAPRPRSAQQLARRYEVSTRTIERDILALQNAGVPIYAETGRLGGYVIEKAFTLPPVNFTAAEMVAIAVSLARAEGTPFAFAARSALRKVLAAAPAGQLAEAAQLMDRIRLIGTDQPARSRPQPASAGRPDAAGSVPAPEEAAAAKPASGQAKTMVPLAIQEAITARHVLLLDYRDRRDAVTVREVEPVAFAGTRAHWYLLAWCRLRQAARAFRVDRILAAADTGEPAPYRSYADLHVDIPHALVRVPWPSESGLETPTGGCRGPAAVSVTTRCPPTEDPMSAPATNTVTWFEIGAPDVDAAKAFYGPLFGWSFAPDGAYTLITAPGAAGPSGGIFNTSGNIPPYAVFAVQVADVAATAARTEELGGKVVVAQMELEDAMAVAYLTDPNGSMFALFSPKPQS